jgi:DNA-binding NarL/FixJ family response regulator
MHNIDCIPNQPETHLKDTLKRSRVFIGTMPRLLGDILDDVIRARQDLELVGRSGRDDLTAALDREQVDVLILAGDSTDTATICKEFLAVHPALQVVVIVNDGRYAKVFDVRQLTVAEPSPQMLVRAIRPL